MLGSWREIATQVLENSKKAQSSSRKRMAECAGQLEASSLFAEQVDQLQLISVLEGTLAGKRAAAIKLLVLIRSDEEPELNLILSIFAPNQDQTTWGLCSLAPYFEAIKKEFAIE